jgi:Domain of unknown function (DUF3387)
MRRMPGNQEGRSPQDFQPFRVGGHPSIAATTPSLLHRLRGSDWLLGRFLRLVTPIPCQCQLNYSRTTSVETANRRGEQLGLTDDELAFYDALETNDSAVKVLGDETLRTISRELVRLLRQNVTIDWTLKESTRAALRATSEAAAAKARLPARQAGESDENGAGAG